MISCAEKLEKKIVSTYPNGTPMVVNYIKDVHGKKIISKETRFFPNGEKSSEGEWNGESQKTGTWKQWFPNGKKWIVENYKDGKKDGESIVWVNNGNKLYEGEFKDDKASGTWKYYDENGKISKKETLK